MTHRTDHPDFLFRLTLLGTGTIRSQDGRTCASILLESSETAVLIDCGTGSWLRLHEIKKDLNSIDHIFLTHFHPDHIADLVSILFSRYHASAPSPHPVKIYGAPGIAQLYKRLSEAFGMWMSDTMFQIKELNNPPLHISDFQVTWLPLHHAPESVGYRVKKLHKVITISGDSGYCPELIELSRGANIAILECSFPDDLPDEHHLTPSEAGQIAQQAGVKKLILSHFYPEVLRENILLKTSRYFSGEIQLAQDGDSILL